MHDTPELPDEEFRRLLVTARAGDESALAQIAERYGPELLRVVRRTLPRRLRTVFDSQDFLQAVWATLLVHAFDAKRFESPNELRAYLSGVASHKVSDQIRKRLIAQKANLNREVSLQGWEDDGAPTRGSRETPSQFAMARERMELLLRDQPEHHRRVIEMKAAGASAAEIAAAVGLNEGTVRRVLAKASERASER